MKADYDKIKLGEIDPKEWNRATAEKLRQYADRIEASENVVSLVGAIAWNDAKLAKDENASYIGIGALPDLEKLAKGALARTKYNIRAETARFIQQN